jgi:hypothetical protein
MTTDIGGDDVQEHAPGSATGGRSGCGSGCGTDSETDSGPDGMTGSAPFPALAPIRTSDITLVFQGAVKAWVTREHEDFAANVRRTRKVLPGSRIVLSTWAGTELPPGLRIDAVVESPDPGPLAPLKLDERKANNINRQLVTTCAGLAAVTTPYAVKLRTDSYLEHAGFLDHFLEQRLRDGGRERLLASSFFTLDPTLFERLPYHISDWFQFGPTALLQAYWSAPPMPGKDARQYERQAHAPGSTLFERRFRARWAVEQQLCIPFAQARGYACPHYLNDVSPAVMADYRRFLAHEVMLLDPWQIGLRFDKYGWVGTSAFQRLNNLMHLDWLMLADPQLVGREGAVQLRQLIAQRQRHKRLAQLAFRHSTALHALLFDPQRPHHPLRRLAARVVRRATRS